MGHLCGLYQAVIFSCWPSCSVCLLLPFAVLLTSPFFLLHGPVPLFIPAYHTSHASVDTLDILKLNVLEARTWLCVCFFL